MKLISVRSLLVAIGMFACIFAHSHQFPSGRYKVHGFLYLKENPKLVVANQKIFFNGDTLITDSSGKYTYSIFWVIFPRWYFFISPKYSQEYPRHMEVLCTDTKMTFINRAKEYGYLPDRENKLHIVLFNIPVSANLLDKDARIVDFCF